MRVARAAAHRSGTLVDHAAHVAAQPGEERGLGDDEERPDREHDRRDADEMRRDVARVAVIGGASAGSLRIRLPQEKLAAMLSVTRQTTNQLLESLEADGAVRLHVGEIEIVDIDALRRASRLPNGPR